MPDNFLLKDQNYYIMILSHLNMVSYGTELCIYIQGINQTVHMYAVILCVRSFNTCILFTWPRGQTKLLNNF